MRVCYNCRYIYFHTGHPGYSEYTPGESMSLYCEKDHWSLDDYEGVDKLRSCLEQAQHCSDYQHSDKAKELGIPDEDAVALTRHVKYTSVPALCHKCKEPLHTYRHPEGLFVHCPRCAPVESVQTNNQTYLYPRISWLTKKEEYDA